MNKRGKNSSSQLILLAILLAFLAIVDISTLYIWKSFPQTPVATQTSTAAKVTEIIDGDTIKMENGNYVKLIGIDAPEQGSNYYEESKRFLEFLILNKTVKLEKDVQDADSSGKLLRYVYVDYNNQQLFINLESVKQGYSLPFHIGENVKYRIEIEAARTQCLTEKINLCS